ncbi:MAG TPA: cell division protein ZapA [Candidatus Lachnoclostridium stercoravium]|uniref:Cell division protein ZapA n=1 Tax=Candidatus Lachnoclostridium stercoravium TaxID=2838633 RepID=A0A9D2KP16_9FIRM|nr:cell division protein ZapA [Candidatus Lachnoclostridium stercoravium]
MSSKNYIEVLIDGKIYTLGGMEEEAYLQKVANYINEKISLMKKQNGFLKQSADYQSVMTQLNIADDYFKAMEQVDTLEEQKEDLEKEAYSLRHELVTTQMKLDKAVRDLEEAKKKDEKRDVS